MQNQIFLSRGLNAAAAASRSTLEDGGRTPGSLIFPDAGLFNPQDVGSDKMQCNLAHGSNFPSTKLRPVLDSNPGERSQFMTWKADNDHDHELDLTLSLNIRPRQDKKPKIWEVADDEEEVDSHLSLSLFTHTIKS